MKQVPPVATLLIYDQIYKASFYPSHKDRNKYLPI